MAQHPEFLRKAAARNETIGRSGEKEAATWIEKHHAWMIYPKGWIWPLGWDFEGHWYSPLKLGAWSKEIQKEALRLIHRLVKKNYLPPACFWVSPSIQLLVNGCLLISEESVILSDIILFIKRYSSANIELCSIYLEWTSDIFQM